MNHTLPITRTVNALGLKCPEPLMLLHNALNSIHGGSLVEIIGNDPASVRDIHKLCHFLHHQIVFEHAQDNLLDFTIVVQKKEDAGHSTGDARNGS